ncbi:SpaH/EbpB family LPXTG-anchored major pilin [Glutamicibacter creatinolyticus]|uniref:SpaH/EbpB family LPXTG-anchored major pilin n=1 Tax=Glutamicibacter creatinolyticus TaxID=162496 RepID=UPI0031D4FD49
MTSHSPRRLGARLAAMIGAAVIGSLAMAAPSAAAPVNGDIDFGATGSITVHKHEHQASNNPVIADPEGNGATLANPISGVSFTAYPIDSLDLRQPTAWDALSEIDPLTAASCPALNVPGTASLDGQRLGTGRPFGATNAQGISTLGNLPVAAYLVCETGATATANIAEPANPFIVTVPFPDNQASAPSNSGGWIYNVHAYPKNGKAVSALKTVDGGHELGLGAELRFPTTTGIPRIADDAQFLNYTVTDPMDPRLDPTGVASVSVGGTAVDPSYYSVERDRNVLIVSFNQAGLAWLKLQGGKDVVTVFTGTVTSLAAVEGTGLQEGRIFNQAFLTTDHEVRATPPSTPELPPLKPGEPIVPTDPVDPQNPFNPFDPKDPDLPPTTPSNVVTSHWGDLRLFKQDANAAGTGLNGAEFRVYEAAAPYAGTCSIERADASAPLSVEGRTTFTSASGVVKVPGLFVSDSENPAVNAAKRCYVVEEVTAPAGFILPTGDAALKPVAVSIGATAGYDLTLDNTKQDMPALPLTGAQGQLLLMIGGAALLIIGIGTTILVLKRAKHNS